MRLSFVLALGFVVLTTLARSQDTLRPSGELEKLRRDRLAAAEKGYEALSKVVPDIPVELVVSARERILQSKLDLANSRDQKLAAYEEALRYAADLEQAEGVDVRPVHERSHVEFWVLDLRIRRLELISGQE